MVPSGAFPQSLSDNMMVRRCDFKVTKKEDNSSDRAMKSPEVGSTRLFQKSLPSPAHPRAQTRNGPRATLRRASSRSTASRALTAGAKKGSERVADWIPSTLAMTATKNTASWLRAVHACTVACRFVCAMSVVPSRTAAASFLRLVCFLSYASMVAFRSSVRNRRVTHNSPKTHFCKMMFI